MPQSVGVPSYLPDLPDDRAKVAGSQDFQKFRSAVASVAQFVSPLSVLPMLDLLLIEELQKELQRLKAQPNRLREHLELRGDVTMLELLKENWEHLGSAAYVSEKFGIPRSTLHREKDAGRVIAFSPDKSEFVFPHEQFLEGQRIAEWAEAIIGAVGNGAPALHFLYVPRKQLEGQSLAQALRSPAGRDVPVLIHRTVARLAAE